VACKFFFGGGVGAGPAGVGWVSDSVLAGGGVPCGGAVAGPVAVGVEPASGMAVATVLPEGVGRVSDLLQAARPSPMSRQITGIADLMKGLLVDGRGL
jgi:hypothetical protein